MCRLHNPSNSPSHTIHLTHHPTLLLTIPYSRNLHFAHHQMTRFSFLMFVISFFQISPILPFRFWPTLWFLLFRLHLLRGNLLSRTFFRSYFCIVGFSFLGLHSYFWNLLTWFFVFGSSLSIWLWFTEMQVLESKMLQWL